MKSPYRNFGWSHLTYAQRMTLVAAHALAAMERPARIALMPK